MPVSTAKPRPVVGRGERAAFSVREVCLIGIGIGDPDWSGRKRLTRSGRAYRVEASQRPVEVDAPGYVHLRSDPGRGRG